MPQGWHKPKKPTITLPKRIMQTGRSSDEEKKFLLDRIGQTLQTYHDVFEIAKEEQVTRNDKYLSGWRETRNNFVGAATFVATVVIAVLAVTTNPSFEKNLVIEVIRTHSSELLGGAIIFAVVIFVGLNLFMRSVGMRLSAIEYALLGMMGHVNILRNFIDKKSIKIESIEPKQLSIFLQFIKVSIDGNRTALFEALKKTSKFKLFLPPTKIFYHTGAIAQRFEFRQADETYSAYRDEFFKEREFLKEVLPIIESFIKGYNGSNGILEDPLLAFVQQYVQERTENLNLYDLSNIRGI